MWTFLMNFIINSELGELPAFWHTVVDLKINYDELVIYRAAFNGLQGRGGEISPEVASLWVPI